MESKNPETTLELSTSGDSDGHGGSQKSTYQKIYNFFGFTRPYNFPLYVIFAGAMFGFSLSRLRNYDYDKFIPDGLQPMYMYYFHGGTIRIGMIMHLAGCLPAGLLMVFQFLPVIRHKFMFFHRVNGYIVLLLLCFSSIGAAIAMGHVNNGDRTAVMAAEIMLLIITTLGMGMAYYNVKRLQIDQHRAWMLRTMFYFGVVLSNRIIQFVGGHVLAALGSYYLVYRCDEIDYEYRRIGVTGILEQKYPQCLMPNGTTDGRIAVHAGDDITQPEGWGAALELTFAVGMWVSMVLHIIGVELYLGLTPKEAARLRQVSYERQLKAGYKHPGSAGTTADRFGDADEWKPSHA